MNGSYAAIQFDLPPTLAQFKRYAPQIAAICKKWPKAQIAFFTTRYDNDPRDIWEIPEAWIIFAAAADLVDRLGLKDRLAEDMPELLQICRAQREGKRVMRSPSNPERIMIFEKEEGKRVRPETLGF